MKKTYKAIRIAQPFGEFFVTSFKAIELLEIAFSDALRFEENGEMRGSQRKLDERVRVKEITNYINSEELAFPNSIIVAANYNEDGFIEDDDSIRWTIDGIEGDLYNISIPSNKKLAAIIDGQHRLNGFKEANEIRKMETDLLVAIYFDLPAPLSGLFIRFNKFSSEAC